MTLTKGNMTCNTTCPLTVSWLQRHGWEEQFWTLLDQEKDRLITTRSPSMRNRLLQTGWVLTVGEMA